MLREPRDAHVLAGRLVLALALLAVWHLTADLAGERHVAKPAAVLHAVLTATVSGTLVPHLLATLRLAAAGFAWGAGAGVAVPLLLLPFRRLNAAVHPYVMGSAGIPKYALLPLLILWLGIDDTPRICLVALLVFYPIYNGVQGGVHHVDQRLVSAVRVFGGTTAATVRLVIWPSVLPFLFAAARVAVPRAVSAAVIAELLVGGTGIGYLIEASRQNLDVPGVFAGVAVACALVTTVTGLMRRLESAAVRSHGASSAVGSIV